MSVVFLDRVYFRVLLRSDGNAEVQSRRFQLTATARGRPHSLPPSWRNGASQTQQYASTSDVRRRVVAAAVPDPVVERARARMAHNRNAKRQGVPSLDR